MNFVFWFLIILALIAVWILFSFAFRGIGDASERIKKYVKKNMEDEKDEKG